MRRLDHDSWHSLLFAPRFMRMGGSRKMIDHAGQPTTSFNPSSIGRGKDAGTGGMSSEAYREFIRHMRRRSAEPAWTLFVGAMMLLLILLTAPLVVSDVAANGFTLDTLKQGVWVIVFAVIALYAFTTHGLTHETMVRELLARSHCASCGFNLVEIPPRDDGLSRCPECGACWRIAPHPPAA